MLPSLFISHGAPSLALGESPAKTFLKTLPSLLPEQPKAILVISAHWEEYITTLNGTGQHTTIHDFGGFPEALYRMRYPAPGSAALVERVRALLQEHNIPSMSDGSRGLDHGAWIPLLLAWPDADIPVVQLSLVAHASVEDNLKLGRALAALREEGILILGSGSFTHDLRDWIMRGSARGDGLADQPAWVTDFSEWMHHHIVDSDFEALRHYRTQAPFARRNHPTEEHLMPLFVALAAAGETPAATLLHSSADHGVLRMDAYRFEG